MGVQGTHHHLGAALGGDDDSSPSSSAGRKSRLASVLSVLTIDADGSLKLKTEAWTCKAQHYSWS